MTKRHAKPSSAQLLHRVYRQQLAIRAQIDAIKSGQAMLSERMESFRVLADHCARLLREKETLQKQLAAVPSLKDSIAIYSPWRAPGEFDTQPIMGFDDD